MHPDDPTQHVSHETIYSAVYLMPRGELVDSKLKCNNTVKSTD
jgi:hypothetical protein